ncbi:ATP-binding protein [Caldilinea sp.]|uniref:ATP-binding protein n=1 Tax=Caldilinea sp. TaxID=2293560 RepID=UPI002B55A78D|nr:response regulator [Caldilinea sp.]
MHKPFDDQQPDAAPGADHSLRAEFATCILADQVNDAIFVLTTTGKIVYANLAAQRLVGADEQLAGRQFSQLLGGGQARRHAALIRSVNAHGSATIAELPHRYGATTTWFSVHYAPLRCETDTSLILATLRNVTLEVETRERQQQIAEERDLLYRAGAELGRSLDLDHIFPTMRSLISERMDCDVLYLSSFDPETELITCLFAWQDGHALDITSIPQIKLAPEGKGTQSLAIRTGQSILLTDYNAQRRTSSNSYYVSKTGSVQAIQATEVPEQDPNVPRAALIVPLKLSDTVRGVVQIFSYRLNAYSQRDLHLVEAVGVQVLVAVNNALLYRTVRQEQAKLEDLNKTLEQRVVERTARLAEAQRIAHLGSLDIDLDRAEASLSDEACRILRIPSHQTLLPLRKLSEFVLAEDLNHILDLYQQCNDEETHELQIRLLRADGANGYLSLRAKSVLQGGRVVRIVCTALDVTEQRRAEQEQHRQSAILEATTDLVANWNPQGELTYLNLGGRRMLGIGPDFDIANFSLRSIYAASAWPAIEREAIPVATRRGVWAGDSVILHAEGVEIPVSQVIIAHRDGHATVEYYSTIMRDMMLQKQAEEALRRSRDELSSANTALEKAARLKDEFLAGMSHELRTPMTSILGLTEALREQLYGSLNEKQLRAVTTIEHSGQHLLDLINDILDLSKIEAGQFQLHRAPFSVDETCMAALQMIKGMAQQKRQSVGFTINLTSIEIDADQRRLKQMLVNLLSNAVKFTPEGGQLGLDVQADAKECVVQFHVWDRGIGIAPEDFARLFQPFTQLDGRLARQYTGTGLGLSLVRRMAELHGGSVTLASVVGEGSRFTLSLPWHPSTRQAEGSSPLLSELPSSLPLPRRPRPDEPVVVLLVDDNLAMMEMYVDYLRNTGCVVHVAEDGLAALRALAEIRPDVVLMDIQMPGMDGLEVIRRIRSWRDPDIAAAAVVALTALAMPGDRERCLDAGADDYLAKPVSLIRVGEVVERLANAPRTR